MVFPNCVRAHSTGEFSCVFQFVGRVSRTRRLQSDYQFDVVPSPNDDANRGGGNTAQDTHWYFAMEPARRNTEGII